MKYAFSQNLGIHEKVMISQEWKIYFFFLEPKKVNCEL